jgi:hypothetical protein
MPALGRVAWGCNMPKLPDLPFKYILPMPTRYQAHIPQFKNA